MTAPDKALMPDAAVPVAWQRRLPLADEEVWVDVREADLEHYRKKGQPVRPLYTTPTPVEEPEKRATGELATIIACMDEMLADPRLDALAFDKDDSRIIRAALAATNAGQVEAAKNAALDLQFANVPPIDWSDADWTRFVAALHPKPASTDSDEGDGK